MSKTKTALKLLAGTLAATVLVIGTASVPAQANDTGWGVRSISPNAGMSAMRSDTGWG
jgi:hypothetical protein